MISLKFSRSFLTSLRALFRDAALKRDPAYLPDGISVKAGGLWLGTDCTSEKKRENLANLLNINDLMMSSILFQHITNHFHYISQPHK